MRKSIELYVHTRDISAKPAYLPIFLPKNGTDRIGQVILPSDDGAFAADLLKKIGKCIFIDENPMNL